MYLPDGWAHATLNHGETIGVGGQAIWDGPQRLQTTLDGMAAAAAAGGGDAASAEQQQSAVQAGDPGFGDLYTQLNMGLVRNAGE